MKKISLALKGLINIFFFLIWITRILNALKNVYRKYSYSFFLVFFSAFVQCLLFHWFFLVYIRVFAFLLVHLSRIKKFCCACIFKCFCLYHLYLHKVCPFYLFSWSLYSCPCIFPTVCFLFFFLISKVQWINTPAVGVGVYWWRITEARGFVQTCLHPAASAIPTLCTSWYWPPVALAFQKWIFEIVNKAVR